jgi:hypothetical protein
MKVMNLSLNREITEKEGSKTFYSYCFCGKQSKELPTTE